MRAAARCYTVADALSRRPDYVVNTTYFFSPPAGFLRAVKSAAKRDKQYARLLEQVERPPLQGRETIPSPAVHP